MDIPKIFILENEKLLEERIQYLLKEPKLEPTELLEVNGKLYVVFTHTNNRKTVMERCLDDYYLEDCLDNKMVKLVEYEFYKKTKA